MRAGAACPPAGVCCGPLWGVECIANSEQANLLAGVDEPPCRPGLIACWAWPTEGFIPKNGSWLPERFLAGLVHAVPGTCGLPTCCLGRCTDAQRLMLLPGLRSAKSQGPGPSVLRAAVGHPESHSILGAAPQGWGPGPWGCLLRAVRVRQQQCSLWRCPAAGATTPPRHRPCICSRPAACAGAARAADQRLPPPRRCPACALGLLPALQRDESVAGAEDSPAVAELGAVLLGGLRALHVYSNTGQGRSMGGPAREPVQAAWQAREQLLTAAQRKQLEGFVSSSRNFAALLDDKEPSPQPVRRDYVPAPRQQPQPKEKKQKRAAAEEEPAQPQLSKRQQKRLQAAQRAEAEAAARAQRAAEAAAQAAAAPPPPPVQQQRGSDDAEAAQQNKRYKLTIKLGSGSLAALGEGAAAEAPPPPAPPLPPAPAPEDRQLAAALDEHWRWHEQQQGAQQQQQPSQQGSWSEQPAPPPEDAPGGWQQLAPLPGEQPSRPGSAAVPSSSAPLPDAAAGPAANGSVAAAAPLDLDPAALDHAASGSPAIRELLG